MLKLRLSLLISIVLFFLIGLGTPNAIAAPVSSSEAIAQPVTNIAGGSMFSFSGTRPDNLGVKEGKLAPCPDSPNCVNSQSPTSDEEHHVEPLTYSSSPSEAMEKLKSVIQTMERTNIVTEDKTYLYAEFSSALMGFVDDVEFYLDESDGVIHVRSASRLGQSDLGVNRKRIEAIREQFA
ncbi:MAG: DUF1499 domain-containing protein [Elainellaceae cyanobacterium]